MLEERKKFSPKFLENDEIKEPTKSGKPAFQSKKIIDNNFNSAAGSCKSLRKEFDNYIDERYSGISNEKRQLLWINVSDQMLIESNSKLEELIENYYIKNNLS